MQFLSQVLTLLLMTLSWVWIVPALHGEVTASTLPLSASLQASPFYFLNSKARHGTTLWYKHHLFGEGMS